jgi:acetylornithine deacetylase/succinyl-diaminopimelate desuccinylase-like protein
MSALHQHDHASITKVHAHIDTNWPHHLAETQAFVRQPSIGADGTGMGEMVNLVADRMREIGAAPQILPTNGYPVIYGEIMGQRPVTLLLYGMYDVQPVTGEQWDVDPFAAAIVDRPPYGPCLIGRGSLNSKGPLAGMFNAIESIQTAVGQLPIGIKFIIEGEEELGSRHLPAFIEAHRHLLNAHAGFFPFYRQDATGKPIIYLGCKGVIFFELVARGGSHGGPTRGAAHGSRAVWFHNPAWWLVHALSTLLSTDQTRVLIEGFYDDIRPPTAEDEELLAALQATFDPRTQLFEFGFEQFKYNLQGLPLIRKYLYEPTLNLDGLDAGHADEGNKSMIPAVARAKFDCRLVLGMRPERVISALRRHLDNCGLGHTDLIVHDAYPAARTSVRSAIVQALITSYRAFDRVPEVWPTITSSMPLYLFTERLGLDTVSGGLGHGGGAHAANEYATVEGMRAFEKSLATLLYAFGNQINSEEEMRR